MKKNKPASLGSLIRRMGPEIPPLHFTESVMSDIMAEASDEAAIDPMLKALLRQMPVESPPAGFTLSVMEKVAAAKGQEALEPIIPRKTGYLIAACATVIVILIGSSDQSSSPQVITSYFTELGNGLSSFFRHVGSVPPVFPLTVIAMSALLIIDQLASKRRVQIKNGGR